MKTARFRRHCLLINISEGGAAFRGQFRGMLEVGETIQLDIQSLPRLTASVRWVGENAFGVAFDENSSDNGALRRLVMSKSGKMKPPACAAKV